jgi:hypothetical protein
MQSTSVTDITQPCRHQFTLGSSLGTQFTAASQSAPGSLPFYSPGKLNGLYLMRQFADVFDSLRQNAQLCDGPLGCTVFTPSFNEFTVDATPIDDSPMGSVANKYVNAIGISDDDPDRFSIFVDGYGAGRSRTLEPSVDDKGRQWAIYSSCVRVARLIAHESIWHIHEHHSSDSASNCGVSGEICCEVAPDQLFAPVYSLESHSIGWNAEGQVDTAWNASDTLHSNSRHERDMLVHGEAGSAAKWWEVCVPYLHQGIQTDFCTDDRTLKERDHPWPIRGPFYIWRNTTEQGSLPPSRPLFRCTDPQGGSHFVATDRCGEGHTPDLLLGFISAAQDSTTARPLRKCVRRSAPRLSYTTVDGPCLRPTDVGEVLGFVV